MGAKKKTASGANAGATSLVRRSRGRTRDGASFPVPPPRAELPADYAATLHDIKQRIQESRLRVVLAASSAMVLLYWDIGRLILDRQEREGWGAKVIERLASDLGDAYPEMKGLSTRNLLFMRSFSEAYPDREKVKQLVSRLPWGHVIRILQRVKEPAVRDWYVAQAIEHGWSRSILELRIDAEEHTRHGKALNNFARTLPPGDSDMAAQVFKDPYLFDFLGTADPRREREVEQALVDHVQRFLLELGAGFAFVGRQVHLEIGASDFYVDLLFYHLKLRTFVVVELKSVPFDPAFVVRGDEATARAFLTAAVRRALLAIGEEATLEVSIARGRARLSSRATSRRAIALVIDVLAAWHALPSPHPLLREPAATARAGT